ncbi:hypothetical protein L596_014407 [Steinernema carpocapsae]|uniref:Uncharacterized protein n=1 Tax=Steinernema carpocapsae TaxID=34508 RepID=A0A4U5NC23_STECR|nr:hypothetical protein L596_014407 [Steinernema carpocapsae]
MGIQSVGVAPVGFSGASHVTYPDVHAGHPVASPVGYTDVHPMGPGPIHDYINSDIEDRNRDLADQLSKAHNHIEDLRTGHDTASKYHGTVVERLEADIIKGQEQQSFLLSQIASLNATIQSLTTSNTIKAKLIDQLVRIVTDFQILNVKLFKDIHILHSVIVSSEQKHQTRLVSLKEALKEFSNLLYSYESENSADINTAVINQQSYKMDNSPTKSYGLLLDHYKSVEAAKQLHEPGSVDYYGGLLKQLQRKAAEPEVGLKKVEVVEHKAVEEVRQEKKKESAQN